MKQWQFYTNNAVKPRGWLRRQLEIQAAGLSGNLDKVWRDVRDSAWIGGDAEGWERVPYWLDGFVPLAWLLDDADLQRRAKNYIDAILASQRRDGWMCPCKTGEIPKYDTWAVHLLSKVLTVYYNCTGDERVPPALYDMLRNYYDLLKTGSVHLFDWGKARWFEAMIAIDFLYERRHEAWLKELAALLKSQGTDYGLFRETWKRPLNKWTFETHVVNLAMMLKSECVSCDLLGEAYKDLASDYAAIIDEYNGTAVGTFTGDECLSGKSPIQGTELCAVAELMYSLELLYAYTGNPKWAERLEVVAFNALPATISDDMWTHQYDQMVNQINCIRFPGRPVFRTNGEEAHLFGLEPNFGCCTANFNQAWPKLAQSVFLHNGGDVLSALMLPAALNADGIRITLETNYPFENTAVYRIQTEKAFTLHIRIPSFARALTVDGEPATCEGEIAIAIAAGEDRTVRVAFTAEPQVIPRPDDMAVVRCGSLVYALPIQYEAIRHEYERNQVERKFPYCDYEYKGVSPWQFALERVESDAPVETEGDGIPFSSEHPPLALYARVRPIAWEYEDGFDTVCAKSPQNITPAGAAQTLALVPYGCAKLRVTELPLLPL